MELGAGVPANWIVLVVGVIVDWAFAEKVANAKTARQNKTAANFPGETDLLGANDARITEGLTFGLPVPETLASGIFYWHSRRHHPNCRASYLQHDLYPEGTANCACRTKEQSTVLEIYLQRFTSRFLAQKKRVNEQTRYLEQKNRLAKSPLYRLSKTFGLPRCGCTPGSPP